MRLKDHRFPEAIDILKEIVAVDKRNEDAWCLLARAQMDARQVKEAQHSLDYVLKSLDKFNTYALCSLANLYFWKYRHVVDRKDV